jgi:hypothetical protein
MAKLAFGILYVPLVFTEEAQNGGIRVVIDVIKEIGKQVINHQIKKHTGIDMG